MDNSFTWLKWGLSLLAIFIAVAKYYWIVYAPRKMDLIISPRLFTMYSSRRIEDCSSYTKKHFMEMSNWISITFWASSLLAAILWLINILNIN